MAKAKSQTKTAVTKKKASDGKNQDKKASSQIEATTTTRKIKPVTRAKAGPGMKRRIMTDKEVFALYGSPGNTNNFTQIICPFPMIIAWDTKVKVNKLTCHKKIAQPLSNVLKDLVTAYGASKINSLGIDLYGGLYNKRLMRGSTTRWSRHSWAIAIDLDPARNQLREDHTTARFARPEYKPMIDIFHKYGFVGYGPEKDYDWMHFEIGI